MLEELPWNQELKNLRNWVKKDPESNFSRLKTHFSAVALLVHCFRFEPCRPIQLKNLEVGQKYRRLKLEQGKVSAARVQYRVRHSPL